MRPTPGVVLVLALGLASPALWQAVVEQTLPPDVAFLRLVVTVALTWAGLSVLSALVGPPPKPDAAPDPEPEDELTTNR